MGGSIESHRSAAKPHRSRVNHIYRFLLPHGEMLPRLQHLGSNTSAGELTVESRQSVQRPVGVFVTELLQIRSLVV